MFNVVFSVLLLLCSTGYISCAHEKNYILTKKGNKEYVVHAFDPSKNTRLPTEIVLQTEFLNSIERIKNTVMRHLTHNYNPRDLPKSNYKITDLYFVNPTDKSKIAIPDERCIQTTLDEKGYYLEAAILPKTFNIECCEKNFEGKDYQFNVLIEPEKLKNPEHMQKDVANVRRQAILLPVVHNYQGTYTEIWARIGDCDVDLYCVNIQSGEKLDIHNPDIEKGLNAGTHTLKADIQRKELN